jgi:hypothetical protein
MNVSAVELVTLLPCRPRSKRPSKPSRRTPPPVYHFPTRRVSHSPHSPSPIPPVLRRILRRILLLRRRRRTGLKMKVTHEDDGCPQVHHTARYPQAVRFHSKKWNGGLSLGHEASARRCYLAVPIANSKVRLLLGRVVRYYLTVPIRKSGVIL